MDRQAKYNKKIYACSSSRFPYLGVRLVIRHSAVPLFLSFISIVPCFLSSFLPRSLPFLVLDLSSDNQDSHLSCGLPHFLQPPCFFVSDPFRNLLTFILTGDKGIKDWDNDSQTVDWTLHRDCQSGHIRRVKTN